MTGIDRQTGRVLDPWSHTLQSVEVIFTTQIGERLMHRDFGLGMERLLGRLLVPRLFLAFKSLIVLSLEAYEPRLKLRKLSVQTTPEQIALGAVHLILDVDFMPKAHLGDFTVDSGKSLDVSLLAGRFITHG